MPRQIDGWMDVRSDGRTDERADTYCYTIAAFLAAVHETTTETLNMYPYLDFSAIDSDTPFFPTLYPSSRSKMVYDV